MALGRPVDISINHDPEAVAMHTANHPDTAHYCESVWEVDPRKACGNREVEIAWFSPDCKHFSKAKGGKPVDRNIRGLAWVAVRWAATVKPKIIMLENVEEFKTWGPVKDGVPFLDQKGRSLAGKNFNTFVNALNRLGYKVEWKELRACDFGVPTTRKRFFLIARCDGKPISWPAPTHGDLASLEVQSGKLKPWKTAADIIDWSIPCPSIFERKRPLAENTMKRIARGLQRFVIESDKPFIVKCNHGSNSFRGQSIDNPIQTLTSKNGFALVTAFLAKHYGGNYTGAGINMNAPTDTVTTVDHHALITSHLVKLRNGCIGTDVREPVHTITSGGGHIGEVRAFLVKYYGTGEGCTVDEPLHTVTTKDRFGLVTIKGEDYQIVDIGMRMLTPRELYRAQGFPDSYVIDALPDGTKLSKAAQVRMCGNSVCPPLAAALIQSNTNQAIHRSVAA
jgi:DNA (cytosine-5)-methyltransferase 1